jgi:flagellar biosynthesis protein FlhG
MNIPKQSPVIWAVGGGKGGVGTSVMSTLIALSLSKMGHKTILMDVDFGGANLHTLLGIKNSPRTVYDYLQKKYSNLVDICIDTEVDNLRILSGASDILPLANLKYAQKIKIIQSIFQLDTDHVVMDLGAGTSYNVLDFFLIAHNKVVVLTPQPGSIQNAYAFVRNGVYRKISRLTSQKTPLFTMIQSVMDPNNELKVKTIKELLQLIQTDGSREDADMLRREIQGIQPMLITNMIRNSEDKNAARIIQLLAEKYLMIHPAIMAGIAYDPKINAMVSRMVPLTRIEDTNRMLKSVEEISERLSATAGMPPSKA